MEWKKKEQMRERKRERGTEEGDRTEPRGTRRIAYAHAEPCHQGHHEAGPLFTSTTKEDGRHTSSSKVRHFFFFVSVSQVLRMDRGSMDKEEKIIRRGSRKMLEV